MIFFFLLDHRILYRVSVPKFMAWYNKFHRLGSRNKGHLPTIQITRGDNYQFRRRWLYKHVASHKNQESRAPHNKFIQGARCSAGAGYQYQYTYTHTYIHITHCQINILAIQVCMCVCMCAHMQIQLSCVRPEQHGTMGGLFFCAHGSKLDFEDRQFRQDRPQECYLNVEEMGRPNEYIIRMRHTPPPTRNSSWWQHRNLLENTAYIPTKAFETNIPWHSCCTCLLIYISHNRMGPSSTIHLAMLHTDGWVVFSNKYWLVQFATTYYTQSM